MVLATLPDPAELREEPATRAQRPMQPRQEHRMVCAGDPMQRSYRDRHRELIDERNILGSTEFEAEVGKRVL